MAPQPKEPTFQEVLAASLPSLFPRGHAANPSNPREVIARALSPLVAVSASSHVEELCQRNNLPRFVDLLQPFGDNIDGRVFAKDSNGLPMPHDHFYLRFRELNGLEEPDARMVAAIVNEFISANAPKQRMKKTLDTDAKSIVSDASSDNIVLPNSITRKVSPSVMNVEAADAGDEDELVIRSVEDVDDAYLSTNIEEFMPWYREFRDLCLAYTGVHEHETFNHPAAVILAVSAHGDDPVYELQRMIDPNRPCVLYDKGYLDPNILKYYIIVHDSQRGSISQSQNVLDRMRRTFGINCYMIKLNSLSTETTADGHVEDIWRPYMLRKLLLKTYRPPVGQGHSRSFSDGFSGFASGRSTTYAGGSHHVRQASFGGGSHADTQREATDFGGDSIIPVDYVGTADPYALPTVHPYGQGAGIPTPDREAPPTEFVEEESIPRYGKALSEEDVKSLRTMVKEFLVQSLVPHLEKSVQVWNEQVAAQRRGVAGRLYTVGRRFFGAAATNQVVGNVTGAQPVPLMKQVEINGVDVSVYHHTSPEAQLRRLADVSFQLGDYRLAQSIYDSLRKDFAAEKAHTYQAGAQELLGLCYLMGSGGGKYDFATNLDTVIGIYLTKVRSPILALNCVLMHYEVLRSRGMWGEAARALEKVADDASDLRAAVLFEQAAHCYLRLKGETSLGGVVTGFGKPRVRKYAFCMVLAGYRYGKASQREHSFRCYRAASQLFDDKSWSVIDSHIHFALGRQSFYLNEYHEALGHFMRLLRESEQSPAIQGLYLREFLYVYKQYAQSLGKDPLAESGLSLPIPVVDDNSVMIQLAGHRSTPEGVVDEAEEMAWRELEKGAERAGLPAAPQRLYANIGLPLPTESDEPQQPTCATGESVTVHMMVHNPLQVPLSITNIVLECLHELSGMPSSNTKVHAKSRSTTGTATHQSTMITFDNYDLESLWEIVLAPGEHRPLQLKIVPRTKGVLRVLGMHFTINNMVPGYKKFWKRGKRLNATKQERMQQLYAPDRSLELLVTPPMPLLQATVHAVPASLFSGEVAQVRLELRNSGDRALKNLFVRVNSNSMVKVGTPDQLSKTAYEWESVPEDGLVCAQGVNNTLEETTWDPIGLASTDEADSSDALLKPTKHVMVPLWIRGERIGKHSVKMVLVYGSEDPEPGERVRIQRVAVEVNVVASLRINTFTRPSACHLDEFVLGVEVENLHTSTEFELTQLSLTSPRWAIACVGTAANESKLPETTLAPRATIFSYFYLTRVQSDANTDLASVPETYTVRALHSLNSRVADKMNFHAPPVDLYTSHLANAEQIMASHKPPLVDFYHSARLFWRKNSLQSIFGGVFENAPQAFTLYSSNDVDLNVCWRVSGGNTKHFGNHHVVGINLGSLLDVPGQSVADDVSDSSSMTLMTAGSVPSASNASVRRRFSMRIGPTTGVQPANMLAVKEENPVKVVLRSPSEIVNDFDQGLCWANVTVLVKNISSSPIRYVLDLVDLDKATVLAGPEGLTPTISTSFRFDWSGQTRLSGELASGARSALRSAACFSRPGVYNLNRWRLTIYRAGSVETKMVCLGDEEEEEIDPSVMGVQTPNQPHLVSVSHVSGYAPTLRNGHRYLDAGEDE